jgi:hypothetical protein
MEASVLCFLEPGYDMSGMDPHMISGNIGMGNGYVLVGLCRSGFY